MEKSKLDLLETDGLRSGGDIGTNSFSAVIDAEGKSLADLLKTYRQLGFPDTVLENGNKIPIEFFKDLEQSVESIQFEYENTYNDLISELDTTGLKQHKLHIQFKNQKAIEMDCVTSYFGKNFQKEIIDNLQVGDFGKYRNLLDVAKDLQGNRRLVDVLKYEIGMTTNSVKDQIYLNAKIRQFELVEVEGKPKLFVKFSDNDKERYISLDPKRLDRDPLRRTLDKQSELTISKLDNVFNKMNGRLQEFLSKIMDKFIFDPLEKSSFLQQIIEFSNRKNNSQDLQFATASPSLESQLSRQPSRVASKALESDVSLQRPVEALRTPRPIEVGERTEFIRMGGRKPITPNIEKASQILFTSSIALDIQKNILKQHDQQLSNVMNVPGEKICLNIQSSVAKHIDQNAVRFSRPYLITNDRNYIISNKADIGAIKDAFVKENKGQLFAKQVKELPKAKSLILSR